MKKFFSYGIPPVILYLNFFFYFFDTPRPVYPEQQHIKPNLPSSVPHGSNRTDIFKDPGPIRKIESDQCSDPDSTLKIRIRIRI